MAKIPFNIKYRPQIENGEYKVVTSHDEPVKILTFERKHRFPILALINRGYDEIVEYDIKGWTGYASDTLYVITDEPEPQLTVFEKELLVIMRKEGIPFGLPTFTLADHSDIHSYAERLLSIARKDFEQEPERFIQAELERLERLKNRLKNICEKENKDAFVKALHRAVDLTKKGYDLTTADENAWWADFKQMVSISQMGEDNSL